MRSHGVAISDIEHKHNHLTLPAAHLEIIMITISALIAIVPAFLSVTQAVPTLKRSSGGPAHMNMEQARSIMRSYNSGSLCACQQSLCQQITIAQLNDMPDAPNDAKVCVELFFD